MIRTYQFRIKDASKKKRLGSLAGKVNYVWNYLNETSQKAWARDRTWISEFDLNYLTAGVSKDLGLASDTIQSIASEYTARRNKRKRPGLRWRSRKRNLGWIPIKYRAIKLNGDSVVFQKQKYRFWKTREILGKPKTGSFSQNSRGQWFFNIACEVESEAFRGKGSVGVDLGLKTLATLSDGTTIENPKTLLKWADRLAVAQRAHKKKKVTAIQNKIKNIRKDFLHKESTKLVKKYKRIFVGNVSSSRLVKTRMAKSVLDAGWGMFKSMLEYKAISLGVDYKVVDEKYSTVTCSNCFERNGPSGLSALGIRTWDCKCGAKHLRDVNAAKNILRFADGRVSL